MFCCALNTLLAHCAVTGGGKTFHYNLPPYWDDVTGKMGSWSTRLQPCVPTHTLYEPNGAGSNKIRLSNALDPTVACRRYYPFWEFVGSSDFAYCPIEGVPQVTSLESERPRFPLALLHLHRLIVAVHMARFRSIGQRGVPSLGRRQTARLTAS